MYNFVFDRVENIVGNGENAGYQHFLRFPQCFQKDSSTGLLKLKIVWKRFEKLMNKNSHNMYVMDVDPHINKPFSVSKGLKVPIAAI